MRYQSSGEIELSFHCHCRKCQRATGCGHSSAFALGTEDVSLTGEVKYYQHQSDSGAATYTGFCPICGSPLLSKTERFPDRLYFCAATLDDPSTFKPTFVVFEESAHPWDFMDPELKSPES